jgi:hypothetical protein
MEAMATGEARRVVMAGAARATWRDPYAVRGEI